MFERFKLQRMPGSASRKIGGSPGGTAAGGDPGEKVAAIVKVREPGYVPPAARRRSAISDTLFTADLERGRLAELEDDPLVVSVELQRPVGPAE